MPMGSLLDISLRCLLVFYLLLPLSSPVGAASLEKAEDFELEGIGGGSVRLSALRGKVVILNFWATWCPECIEEMPALDGLYREFKDKGLIVLGISIDRKASTVADFLKKRPVSYPILLDSRGEVFVKRYTLVGIPVTFLIDREGYIVEKAIGKQDFLSEDYRSRVRSLLEGGKR